MTAITDALAALNPDTSTVSDLFDVLELVLRENERLRLALEGIAAEPMTGLLAAEMAQAALEG